MSDSLQTRRSPAWITLSGIGFKLMSSSCFNDDNAGWIALGDNPGFYQYR